MGHMAPGHRLPLLGASGPAALQEKTCLSWLCILFGAGAGGTGVSITFFREEHIPNTRLP